MNSLGAQNSHQATAYSRLTGQHPIELGQCHDRYSSGYLALWETLLSFCRAAFHYEKICRPRGRGNAAPLDSAATENERPGMWIPSDPAPGAQTSSSQSNANGNSSEKNREGPLMHERAGESDGQHHNDNCT